MENKKGTRSWTISDELWEVVKGGIPKKQRDPQKEYKHAPDQGRHGPLTGRILDGIFYVLRTGCQWKIILREYGCGSIH